MRGINGLYLFLFLIGCLFDFDCKNDVHSFGAIVAQARREKVCRVRETNNGRIKTAKTLAMRAKYSTNKGL